MNGGLRQSGTVEPELAPVHLIASEEPLLLNEAADRLRARLRAAGFTEREVFDLRERVDWAAFSASAREGSLFASRRIVELRLPEGQPGAEGARAILAWCQSPPAETVLLILAEAWSRRHEGAWTQAVAACGTVSVLWPPRTRHELGAWVRRRLEERGLPADRALVELLVERTEGHLLACAQEIEKLAILTAGLQMPEPRILRRWIADDARFRVFDLAEAALAGDAGRVSSIIEHLRREGEAPAALLPWLGRELLAVAEAAHGTSRAEPRFGERKRAFESALRRAPASFWDRCLIALARAERLAKGHADPSELPPDPRDAWVALERLLIAVALGPRAQWLLP